MSSELAFSICFVLSCVIIGLMLAPDRVRVMLVPPQSKRALGERIQRALYRAGIFDQAPGLMAVALMLGSAVAAVLLPLITGSVASGLFGPVIVLGGTYFYISYRQRQFIHRASEELIPFLNRVNTFVQAGLPAKTAYLNAVEEAGVLREVLEESAAKISSGDRFSDALLETLPLLPLRMWAVFVRQIEFNEQTGGDLATSIQTSVEQTTMSLQLQAEMRADFSLLGKQRNLIVMIIAGALAGIYFLMPDGNERLIAMLTDPIGLVCFLAGVGLILSGIWLMNNRLRDVERKLNI